MPVNHEKIIPKSDIPQEMPQGLSVKYEVTAFGDAKEITEESLSQLVKKIHNGEKLGIYLSSDPYLEEDYMQIEIDHGLIMLQYVKNDGLKDGCFYVSFDPEYLDSKEESPMECSDGQSVILMRYTMRNPESAAKCVEYFVRTGKLYSGMDWLKGWTEWEE
ncbi:MAG: hypothetical protein J6K58_09445 [Lachnospiraceae bacterium]|nr:hypothetical protein [Lachnospiraceae bacterium]